MLSVVNLEQSHHSELAPVSVEFPSFVHFLFPPLYASHSLLQQVFSRCNLHTEQDEGVVARKSLGIKQSVLQQGAANARHITTVGVPGSTVRLCNPMTP